MSNQALNNPIKIIEPFLLKEIGDEFFLIHNDNASIFHLNTLSKLYVECLRQGIPKDQIVTAVADRFKIKQDDVTEGFNQFLLSLSASESTNNAQLNESLRLLEPTDFIYSTAVLVTQAIEYTVGGIVFRITSQNPESLLLIDARLRLMRTEAERKGTTCEIQVLSGENGFAVRVNGEIRVAAEDSNWLDVLVMQTMLDQISNRVSETVILHAAAVANDGGEAFVFAASSGAGKSTLATLLALKGYEYLGDDIVLLNPSTKEITPFPTAPNLKPSSWPLFDKALPELKHQTVFRPNMKPVKFVDLNAEPLRHRSYKVKALIFPDAYGVNPTVLRALNLADSLTYLSEIRSNTGQTNLVTTAHGLIKFTQDIPCFSLQYGDIDDLHSQLSRLPLC